MADNYYIKIISTKNTTTIKPGKKTSHETLVQETLLLQNRKLAKKFKNKKVVRNLREKPLKST